MSVGCAILVTVEIKPDRLDDFLKAGASFFLQCAEKNEDGMCQNRGDPPQEKGGFRLVSFRKMVKKDTPTKHTCPNGS